MMIEKKVIKGTVEQGHVFTRHDVEIRSKRGLVGRSQHFPGPINPCRTLAVLYGAVRGVHSTLFGNVTVDKTETVARGEGDKSTPSGQVGRSPLSGRDLVLSKGHANELICGREDGAQSQFLRVQILWSCEPWYCPSQQRARVGCTSG